MENQNPVENLQRQLTLIDAILEMEEFETRIGINIAAEEAAKETSKNIIKAPKSLEEIIFLSKMPNEYLYY